MTATQTAAAPVVLNDTRKLDALKRIRALGAAYANGLNSKPELAQEVAYLAHEGLINVDPKSKDVADIYADSFLKGGSKHHDDDAGANFDKEGVASVKQQVSKLRQFAIAADHLRQNNLGDFQEVLRRARGRVNKVQDCKLSTYERLVCVARAQKDTNAPLTDAQIDDACLPEGADAQPKGEKDRLQKLVQDMTKMRDGTKVQAAIPSEALSTAIEWIETRIADLTTEEINAKSAALRASLMTRPSANLTAAAQ